MRAYSDDFRERVVKDVLGGGKLRETAKKWKIATRTLVGWLKRYRETGCCHSIKGKQGAKRKLLEYKDLVKCLIEENPNITLSEIQSQLPIYVCLQTIATELKRLGFTFKKKDTGGRTKSSRRVAASPDLEA